MDDTHLTNTAAVVPVPSRHSHAVHAEPGPGLRVRCRPVAGLMSRAGAVGISGRCQRGPGAHREPATDEHPGALWGTDVTEHPTARGTV